MTHFSAAPRPLVSVLMPVLRPEPNYFRQAVASILGQKLTDLELLIVEDPSESAAAPLLSEFSDSRIRHIANKERTDLVRQLNQGLHAARAELVARMDADDVADPDRLRCQVDLLAQLPDVSVVGSQLSIIDENGSQRGYRAYPLSPEAIRAALPRYNPLAHPSVLFRRSVIADAGGYQATLHNEDYDLWSRLALQGHKFANHPEPLLRYRIHSGAVKTTRLRTMIRGTLEVKERYWLPHMNLADRVRLLGERCLLAMPPRLVMAIFKRTTYRQDLPRTAGPAIDKGRPTTTKRP
jgi:glycosyltransferase involved in cell wall biosynthesis